MRGNVIKLDLTQNHVVLDRLTEQINDIEELCVVTVSKQGLMRIMSGKIKDRLQFYGIVTGLAHDYLLHDMATPIDD